MDLSMETNNNSNEVLVANNYRCIKSLHNYLTSNANYYTLYPKRMKRYVAQAKLALCFGILLIAILAIYAAILGLIKLFGR